MIAGRPSKSASRGRRIEVFLADDSFPYRMFLRELIERQPDMVVVGEAGNGMRAVQLATELVPDVIIMDVDMPGLDGVDAAERLSVVGVPSKVIVVTGVASRALLNLQGKSVARVVHKEQAGSVNWSGRLLADIRTCGAGAGASDEGLGQVPAAAEPTAPIAAMVPSRPVTTVLIGASTGGPQAVAQVLKELPEVFPVTVLIVIHVAASFSESMAEWLARLSGKVVRTARHGESVADARGTCLLAPEGKHMSVADGRIVLASGDPINSVCPSVDVLFQSAADQYRDRAVGVLLTGMGRDGADGLLTLCRQGAVTMAQDEASSAIFGMPGRAIELGAAGHVLPLDQIAAAVTQVMGVHRKRMEPAV